MWSVSSWSPLRPTFILGNIENWFDISLFLASSGKNSIIPFQHIVIRVVWKSTTRLLHLSLALYSERQTLSESACSYWPLYTALLSIKWRHYELIGCWNKWRSLHCKTGLWWLDKLSCRQHCQPAWVELRQISLHRCNLPCNRFVSWVFGVNWL